MSDPEYERLMALAPSAEQEERYARNMTEMEQWQVAKQRAARREAERKLLNERERARRAAQKPSGPTAPSAPGRTVQPKRTPWVDDDYC